MTKKRFLLGALGGTFDHFHKGHKHLIREAGRSCDHLLIGVSSEEMIRGTKVWPSELEPLTVRMRAVETYCQNQGYDCTISILSDQIGIAGKNRELQALFYTEDVISGAKAINQYRASKGMTELLLIEVKLLLKEDLRKISSELIRLGEISRTGQVYMRCFDRIRSLLPQQKEVLSKPQGSIKQNDVQKSQLQVIVGDSTLEKFQKEGWPFNLAIIDGKKQRSHYSPLSINSSQIDLIVVNPPGTITPMLANGLDLALKRKYTYVFVEGEEDLASLVLALISPLGTRIYYGQPKMGIVEMIVTEQLKQFLLKVVTQP